MPSSRVTIRDVARVAQVSYQTVSRVINGENHIKPETRQRVLDAVDQLGFVPSQVARSLVTKRTHMVGFVLGDISNPYFADVARGAEFALAAAGWSLVLADTDYDPNTEMTILNGLISKSVDGLIICDTRTAAEELARLAQRVELPMVLLNRTSGDLSLPCLGMVRTDREAAAAEAVTYLAGLGHRRIGLLASERPAQKSETRLHGYRTALSNLGIPYDESLVAHGTLSIEGGHHAGSRLLDLPAAPTAVLCHNDMMAIGLMKACEERDVRIPADLSIVGWDDVPYATVASPPLTTIRVPRLELGRCAAEMLLRLMKHEETPMDVVLPSVLIERESCGPIGGSKQEGR